MLKFTAEQGQTMYFELAYADIDGNPSTPDSLTTTVTELKTNQIVKTLTNFDVLSEGNVGILLDTADLNVGRHYVNFHAIKGPYHQEDVLTLDVQNHEGIGG